MMSEFRGNTYWGPSADAVWRAAAGDLRTSGSWIHHRSRAGLTRELLHTYFRITDPQRKWVYSRKPAINPAAYLVEVMWILAGREDSGPINFFIPPYPRFAGKGPTYHGAYGHRLRKHFGVDQLERAYHVLRRNRESRQVVLQLWDPRVDLPTKNGTPAADDIPCNTTSLLKVRDDKLEWTQIIRSNDVHKGVPVNFVQFMTLQEVLAGWLDKDIGEYCQWSDSLHLYEDDADFYNSINAVKPSASASYSFALEKSTSDRAITAINDLIDWLIASSPARSELVTRVEGLDLPLAYKDTAYLLAADAAYRKYRYRELADQLAHRCEDQRIRFLWRRWRGRLERE